MRLLTDTAELRPGMVVDLPLTLENNGMIKGKYVVLQIHTISIFYNTVFLRALSRYNRGETRASKFAYGLSTRQPQAMGFKESVVPKGTKFPVIGAVELFDDKSPENTKERRTY